MDKASLWSEKTASTVFIELQENTMICCILVNKRGCADIEMIGKTGTFVWIDLNLFIPAALQAPVTGKTEWRIGIEVTSFYRNLHKGLTDANA